MTINAVQTTTLCTLHPEAKCIQAEQYATDVIGPQDRTIYRPGASKSLPLSKLVIQATGVLPGRLGETESRTGAAAVCVLHLKIMNPGAIEIELVQVRDILPHHINVDDVKSPACLEATEMQQKMHLCARVLSRSYRFSSQSGSVNNGRSDIVN